MNLHLESTRSQIMADAIVDSAVLVETGRIALLARQGLEDPSSLTSVQAQQVFGAFLLLFDPLVRLRGEEAPPPLSPRLRTPAITHSMCRSVEVAPY